MRTYLSRLLLLTVAAALLVLPLNTTPALAQGPCDPVVTQLNRAVNRCAEIELDYACYANHVASAEPDTVRFAQPGDRQPIDTLRDLTTDPISGAVLMHVTSNYWTDPVTIVLFGGADASPQGGASYTLRVDNGQEVCQRTPPGMVLHTKAGKRGRISVNGVLIELASTAYVTMTNPDTMVVANVAGSVTVIVPGEAQQLPVGYQTQVTGISTGQPVLSWPLTPSRYATSAVAQSLSRTLGSVIDSNKEPNRAVPACGGQINVGQTLTGENAVPGQECLYSFCADAGAVVSVSLERISAALNPWIDLRAPDMTLVKANNDIAIGQQNSLICNQGLPVSGCYTIVARSYRNQTAGAFRLTLSGQSACTSPPQRCEVVALGGAGLYTGPNSGSIRTVLPFGAEVEARTSTVRGGWVPVQVVTTGEYGWIDASSHAVGCDTPEIEFPTPAPPRAPVEEPKEPPPTPTPTPCPKCGPFPGP